MKSLINARLQSTDKILSFMLSFQAPFSHITLSYLSQSVINSEYIIINATLYYFVFDSY